MKKKYSLIYKMAALGIFIFLMNAQSRTEPLFTISGYYKNFSVALRIPPFEYGEIEGSVPNLGAVINRLRLKGDFQPWESVSFHLAYELSAKIQDPLLFNESIFIGPLNLPEYRFGDLNDRLYPRPEEPISSFGLFQNLDRFYMVIKTDLADISVGRQPIAWGSARFINPTDIIAPFAFNELDKEERLGVDAVRFRIPLAAMDELDIGFVAGEKFKSDNNAFFLRGKTYRWRTDISAILLAFRKHLLIGLDLARAIGGAGFWLESAYVIPDFFRENRDLNEKDYFRASVGLDYNLNSKTYGFVEYHFSSVGKSSPERYLELIGTSAFREGTVYLFGKHYLNLGCTYQITPLMPFTGAIILNLGDWSFMLSPTIEYNIAENIYLAAGAYVGLGKNPRVSLDMNAIPYVYASEFGAYPDLVFVSFRVYF